MMHADIELDFLTMIAVELRHEETATGSTWLTRPSGSLKPELGFEDSGCAIDYWTRKAVQMVYHYLLGESLIRKAKDLGETCQQELNDWIDGKAPNIPDALLSVSPSNVPLPSDWEDLAHQLVQRLGPIDQITIRMLLMDSRSSGHALSACKDKQVDAERLAQQADIKARSMPD